MATYTPANVTRAGGSIAGTAVASSDKFPNTGKEILIVNNGSGGSINVTIDTPNTVDGNAIANPVVAVANGAIVAIGPFPKGTYNDADGNVNVAYSGTSSVTAKVLRVTPEP